MNQAPSSSSGLKNESCTGLHDIELRLNTGEEDDLGSEMRQIVQHKYWATFRRSLVSPHLNHLTVILEYIEKYLRQGRTVGKPLLIFTKTELR
jgi:hypothetical protein